MKSAYNKPETKVVFVKTAHLCTLSSLGVDNNPQNNVSGDSRQDNSWDIWGNGDYSDED